MKSNAIICIFTITIIFYGCDSTNNPIRVNDSNKVSGCTDITACNYDSDATKDNGNCTEFDVCGICGGDNINANNCPDSNCDTDVCISIFNVNLDDEILDIWMVNNIAIKGFQFDYSGVSATGASGGSAEEGTFTVSVGSATILGFSLGGASIPIGNGLLTQIIFSGISYYYFPRMVYFCS